MPKGEKPSAKEELFCQLYVNNSEFFGNGTRCYAHVHNINIEGAGQKKRYKVANVMAAKLLAKTSIRDRINQLFLDMLNDTVVDSELAYVIKQNRELPAKVAAIREYNRVKKRVSDAPVTIFNLDEARQKELDKILEKNQ